MKKSKDSDLGADRSLPEDNLRYLSAPTPPLSHGNYFLKKQIRSRHGSNLSETDTGIELHKGCEIHAILSDL